MLNMIYFLQSEAIKVSFFHFFIDLKDLTRNFLKKSPTQTFLFANIFFKLLIQKHGKKSFQRRILNPAKRLPWNLW